MELFSNKKNVSLSINASPKDLPFINKTIRHINKSIKYPFLERLVFVDQSPSLGRYEKYYKEDLDKLIILLSNLKEEKVIDDFKMVPTDYLSIKEISKKYFNEDNINPKAKNGSPIFHYLYAWDNCKGDYIFHTDSDMLFYYNPETDWIKKGIEIIEENKNVFMVACGGPPAYLNFFDKILKYFRKNKKDNKTSSISTRYFLMDKSCFSNKLLPIIQKKKGEQLEKSLFYTAEKRGLEKINISWLKINSWAIHPYNHGENFIKYLDDIIWAVENNIYPFYRKKYNWDIYTEGKDIDPWLEVIKEAKKNK